jgi:hypothetical protein
MSSVTPIIQFWSPERAGEEDAHEVGDDRRDEDQCCPVVDLAHDEPRAYVEADAQDRFVGLRHRHTLQWCVAPVVDDLLRSRREEEREVHAGEDQDDEAVERELTQHEGPVVGEDLVQRGADEPSGTEPLVEPPDDALDDHVPRSQKPGPTGSV